MKLGLFLPLETAEKAGIHVIAAITRLAWYKKNYIQSLKVGQSRFAKQPEESTKVPRATRSTFQIDLTIKRAKADVLRSIIAANSEEF